MRFIALGSADVTGGFSSWRMWWMLAKNDVARRYRRSRIGQLWLTLSMAVTVLGMGLVYSLLFNTPIASYLPHVGVGLVLWGMIAGIMTESCLSFTENENIMRQIALPRFTYLLRTIARNLLVFGHNLIILPIVFVACGTAINANMFLFLPGLLLVLANLAWVGYLLAILSARFRDIPQIIQSLIQVAFFVSPVVFKPTQLPPNHPVLILNPFASMLDVMREPLLGNLPSLTAYAILLGLLIGGWLVSLAFAGKYSHRVVYWL
ncbi:ABC transporter permease [Bosea psychrotolerans]|uniref:Lipopolysaccharide transport system permease protein n=1 Tax=Bosea psychrotolerans TaxID=1871628 RepID=A0A2S4LY09_9HYPH|nr:ABC transporter permease [Bosea psychrotolerans]POR47336.1 lipopolysaccharide transport system permease protein [Bosea psychrotolerans]